jgi:hypothetical protein
LFFRRQHDAKWWELHVAATTFALAVGYTRRDVEVAFRRLAHRAHPDVGGTPEAFLTLMAQRDLLLSQAPDQRERRY